VSAADPSGLHPAVGGQIGRAETESLHPRARPADLLDVDHAARRLQDRVNQQRPIQPGPGLELREQAVDVRDVLGPLHLRDHHHVELVADLRHQRGQVVEDPRTVEGVDPGPELGGLEVGLAGDRHQALAGGHLAFGLHRVLEVAEQDVGRARHLRHLGRHLLVRRVEEVDRAARPSRDLAQRLGRTYCERPEEVLRAPHIHGHERTLSPHVVRRYDPVHSWDVIRSGRWHDQSA
jgi:hypothetical protein